MRKITGLQTARALTWPVMIRNGSVLCAWPVEDDPDNWYCLARLFSEPDDPGELTELTPALLAAEIIRHAGKFHGGC